MERQKISVIILTLNCSRTLRKCLDSVKWADEIIILDGGSIDGTLQIAKEYGCKIYFDTTRGDFSYLKNKALSYASHEWVLQIDSDEYIDDLLRKQIIEILSNRDTVFDGYIIPRKNQIHNKWVKCAGWYEAVSWQPHLFKKSKTRFERRVHEVTKVDGNTTILTGHIIHEPLLVHELLSKTWRYSSMEYRLNPMTWRIFGRLTRRLIFRHIKEAFLFHDGWQGLLAAFCEYIYRLRCYRWYLMGPKDPSKFK